jgi:superfamily II DNA or RNA helicase
MSASAADGNRFESLRFEGEWRRYQQLALDAFEVDRRHGRRRTHVVAPPGSGKTLMGLEMVRRLGRRALVLAPNSAIQEVWLQGLGRFCADGRTTEGLAGATPDAPLACLTYQSLCRLDDPGSALDDMAEARWVAERAAATGETPEAVRAEAARWSGAAAERRTRELSRVRAALKREVARGQHPLDLADLLSGPALARLRQLRELGVGTLVLDECHHLASMWGYVVRAAAEQLGPVHLIGLTATPPEELTSDEAELYSELLGLVDFTVPTPAVVKDGYLAPYQELAWFAEPLDSEVRWLREHDQRFRDLVAELHEEEERGFLSFPGWVITRMRYREAAGEKAGDAAGEVSWERFARRRPALARAGVRFLASGGLELPEGAPRGEGYRRPPDLEDWLVLLEDYALRCLRAEASDEAARRYDAVAAALRDLGFQLTRQGIRRGASDVDRLLTASGAKPIALAELVACEHDVRGDGLRALVLADAEVASATRDELATALDPAAGTAPQAVLALANDFRTAPLRPLLVSGRGLRCAPHDARSLLAGLSAATPSALDVAGWAASDHERDGLVQLEARGRDWTARAWVAIATAAFESGATRALVGTRGMLGEGWDAPSVNCLVDLTATTTGVSVRQMRGRSLRLDPRDPDKVASNWDVVCVAPDLARGSADYERFVRKHLHLHAPTEDGAIEAGPSHVHPELGRFAPPPASDFDEINAWMRKRAAESDIARERWRIGEPYVGEELRTVVARVRRPPLAVTTPPERPPGVPVDQRLQGMFAAAALAAGAAGALALTPLVAPLGLVAALGAGAWARGRVRRARAVLTDAAPLDLAARALCGAYATLGELTPEAAGSLTIEPRASGYLRCSLQRATPGESALFAEGLDELLGPVAAPRYLVSRLVMEERGDLQLTARAMAGRRIATVRWHAVPADLGRLKPRAETLASSWRAWLGPSRLVFTQRSDERRRALAEALSQDDDSELLLRDVWR